MKRKIAKFLERFPSNTTSWADATDEVREMARMAREFLEEFEGVIVEPVDFRAIKTPAEWNVKGRAFILACYDRMKEETRKNYDEWFVSWFGQEQDKVFDAVRAFLKKATRIDARHAQFWLEQVNLPFRTAAFSLQCGARKYRVKIDQPGNTISLVEISVHNRIELDRSNPLNGFSMQQFESERVLHTHRLYRYLPRDTFSEFLLNNCKSMHQENISC